MFPRLIIDLNKIRANTRALVGSAPGVAIFGVTKAVLGSPEIARSMIEGGVSGLADSRLANLIPLKKQFDIPIMLMRQPLIEEMATAVFLSDQIMVTELKAAQSLSEAGRTLDRVAEMLLMMEMGDGREGVTQPEFSRILTEINQLKFAKIVGLSANVGCSFGTAPTREQLLSLAKLARQAEEILGRKLPVLSGGNSGCLPLLAEGCIPKEINQLRLGESILLGHETVRYRPIPGLVADAFILEAEVIEVKDKLMPSGPQRRAVIALGRQDVAEAALICQDADSEFLERSSDHQTLRLIEGSTLKVGDRLRFIPSYFALLAAMTSPYVGKVFIGL